DIPPDCPSSCLYPSRILTAQVSDITFSATELTVGATVRCVERLRASRIKLTVYGLPCRPRRLDACHGLGTCRSAWCGPSRGDGGWLLVDRGRERDRR